MLYYNIFNDLFLDFYRKEYLGGSVYIRSFLWDMMSWNVEVLWCSG